MYVQELKSEIASLAEMKAELHAEVIMRYIQNKLGEDEDLNDLHQDYSRAIRRMNKLMSEENKAALASILTLSEKKIRLCASYAWKKGYQLCRNMHSDKHVSFPFENDTVESYMKLYKLESLPYYQNLSEAISVIYRETFENDDFQSFIDDVNHYYADMEFEVLRAGCYLGYLEAVATLTETENGFVENKDMTLHFAMQMNDIFGSPLRPGIESEDKIQSEAS